MEQDLVAGSWVQSCQTKPHPALHPGARCSMPSSCSSGVPSAARQGCSAPILPARNPNCPKNEVEEVARLLALAKAICPARIRSHRAACLTVRGAMAGGDATTALNMAGAPRWVRGQVLQHVSHGDRPQLPCGDTDTCIRLRRGHSHHSSSPQAMRPQQHPCKQHSPAHLPAWGAGLKQSPSPAPSCTHSPGSRGCP